MFTWLSLGSAQPSKVAQFSVGGNKARAGIARYVEFYNARRPHSSLDKSTLDEFYFATLPAIRQAA